MFGRYAGCSYSTVMFSGFPFIAIFNIFPHRVKFIKVLEEVLARREIEIGTNTFLCPSHDVLDVPIAF